jgi:glycosyltransferase involved in cell wall biosynthesis
MKILLCHNYYQQWGGEDMSFEARARMLETYGHHVVRFTLHNEAITSMGKVTLSFRTLWNRQSYRALRELIHRENPEVMHCGNTFPLISPAAYYAAHREGTAVVQTLSNYRHFCPESNFLRNRKNCEDCLGCFFSWRGVVRRCYHHQYGASAVTASMAAFHRALNTWNKKIDRFICLSEFSRQKCLEGGFPAEKMVVKPNFIDPDPGPGPGGEYAVYAGRLSAEKGIETLLTAWRRLKGAVPLKIIGDGPMAKEVEAAAGGCSAIEWLGRRSPEDIYTLLGGASFLVMPSICYETFGRTIIEAFAKGTPVIASDTGAPAELVREGDTGLHFETGNPEDLVRRIKQFLSDKQGQARMRCSARKEYLKKYTADRNHSRLIAIYDKAIAHRQRSRDMVPALRPDSISPD